MEIVSEVLINASPEKVWSRFAAFKQYGSWNPFIKSIEGDVALDKKIVVRMEPPGGMAMTFKPKVLAFEKNKELRWLGHLLIPGLFDGEHKFELIDQRNGTTLFRQSESFKGLLVPFFKKMLQTNTLSAFHLMNAKLKEISEKE